jgi:hemerythrin-like domain-containing protein
MSDSKSPRLTGDAIDTWEMVLVHKMFRREFAEMPGMIRAAAGDRTRQKHVGEFVEFMTHVLHHHHTSEDTMLWPTLMQRVGSVDTDLVRRMEEQHDVVGLALEQIGRLLARWRLDLDDATGEKIAAILAEMSGPLIEHLRDEEKEVLPLVSIHITQEEWDALGEQDKSVIPKGGKGIEVIAMLMQDATPQERARFLGLLPTPVRLIYKVAGQGILRRARARRYPAAA